MDLTAGQAQKPGNELLFEIVRLCDKHKITYYLWMESTLAVIRHENSILEDGSIDIAIPNDQMQRFTEAMKELPDKYFLQSWERGDKLLYPRVCVKGYDTRRVHADIFPLCGIPGDVRVQSRIVHRTYLLKVLFDRKTKNKGRFFLAGITCKRLYIKFYNLLTQITFEDAEYVMFPYGAYGILNVFSKDVIGQGHMSEYAGECVRVPEKYDEYLTRLFGECVEEPGR